jgi:hypothetical protein
VAKKPSPAWKRGNLNSYKDAERYFKLMSAKPARGSTCIIQLGRNSSSRVYTRSARFWGTHYPNTYIRQVPATVGDWTSLDPFGAEDLLPRYVISYTHYRLRDSYDMVCWRPDGSCVVNPLAAQPYQYGRSQRVVKFSPLNYFGKRPDWQMGVMGYSSPGQWVHQAESSTLPSWPRYVWVKSGAKQYVFKYPARFYPDAAESYAAGIVLPADKRKRPFRLSADGIACYAFGVTRPDYLQGADEEYDPATERNVPPRYVLPTVEEYDRERNRISKLRRDIRNLMRTAQAKVEVHQDTRSYLVSAIPQDFLGDPAQVRLLEGKLLEYKEREEAYKHKTLATESDRGRAVHFQR